MSMTYDDLYESIGYEGFDLYEEGIKDTAKKAVNKGKEYVNKFTDSPAVHKAAEAYNKGANKRAETIARATTKTPEQVAGKGKVVTNDMYDKYAKEINDKKALYRTGEMLSPLLVAWAIPGFGAAQVFICSAAVISSLKKSKDPTDQNLAKRMEEYTEKAKQLVKDAPNMVESEVNKMMKALKFQAKSLEKEYKNAMRRAKKDNKEGLKKESTFEEAFEYLYIEDITFEAVEEIFEKVDYEDPSQVEVINYYIEKLFD